jgi:hypothetical protein
MEGVMDDLINLLLIKWGLETALGIVGLILFIGFPHKVQEFLEWMMRRTGW